MKTVLKKEMPKDSSNLLRKNDEDKNLKITLMKNIISYDNL